ncbi:MAG: hypothetical protein U0531_16240 [Dehalococcoidia bacterium]
MQFTYLPVEERFFVRFTAEVVAEFPAGAFTPVANYPVYAIRVRESAGEWLTEFMVPASDGTILWVDMRRLLIARR